MLLATPFAAFGSVILQYHHVSNETPAITSLSPSTFAEHMAYLKDNNFNVVDLPVLMAKIQAKQPLPDKTVAITFDDGYNSVLEHAHPLLKQYNWPYTIFINPKFINDGYTGHIGWEKLNQMAKEGATLANHTMKHDYLVRRPADVSEKDWLDSVMKDIDTAEQLIKQHTGQNHKMLAYPYGEFNLALQQRLADAGYLAFGQHSGAVGPHTDLTRIPRFPASSIYANLRTLKTKLHSLPMPISELKGHNMVMVDNPPTLTVSLTTNDINKNALQCFTAGTAKGIIGWLDDNTFNVTAPKVLPAERSRYNCTAPSKSRKGRFYWFSQPWLNLLGQ